MKNFANSQEVGGLRETECLAVKLSEHANLEYRRLQTMYSQEYTILEEKELKLQLYMGTATGQNGQMAQKCPESKRQTSCPVAESTGKYSIDTQ